MKIKLFLSLFFLLSFCSCAEVARDMGLEEVPDIQLRAGLSGTEDHPATLDPFKKYNLVMAANECRFFHMKVPEHWYWKVYLTVANRKQAQRGTLKAEISQTTPPWGALPNTDFKKDFELDRGEGLQAVLGIGNNSPTRTALLHLCQSGAPLYITIESEVSTNGQLLGPDLKGNSLNAVEE